MPDEGLVPRLKKLNLQPYPAGWQRQTYSDRACDACGSGDRVAGMNVQVSFGKPLYVELCIDCEGEVLMPSCCICHARGPLQKVRFADRAGYSFSDAVCARCAVDENVVHDWGREQLANVLANNRHIRPVDQDDDAYFREQKLNK